jgi:hypothetical protein
VLYRDGHERVADHPDTVRVGDRDRRREQSRLADPFESGHLAVAVEPVAAREDRLAHVVGSSRDDDRDAGPDRPPADDERSLAGDEGGVPDAHARHVGDGIARAGLPESDDDPEVSRPHRGMLAWRPGPKYGFIIDR